MTYEQLGFGMVTIGMAVYAVHVIQTYRRRKAQRCSFEKLHPETRES